MIIFAESHIGCCSSFKANQIEVLIIDLSAAIDENDDVKSFNLQVDFKSDFLPIDITHSALTENADHLFKHLNNSVDGNDDSNVETCQQILRHSIATLTFAFRVDLIRRNLSRAN